ncbi:VOC family protein [Nitrosovibrio tenuis]|uniref:Glyoxylase I family protein n=1 Tax=Nitrosovibrio tenuis TaxID=1233 RepID=A0A1H7IZ99_9PROT|nr:VOC family protein [Nitrosovibrio tenuis]SEK67789.1 glyoxylase I family protein [Nitrosovibrio tenuis]
MSAIGFNHYNLRAPRELLDELKTFYCEIVGLTQGQRPPFESFGYWLYAGDQCVLHLSQTRPDEVRHIDVATTFDHVAFTCTNRPEMEARLKHYNLPFKEGRVPSLGISQLFIKDPAGNGIELSFASNQA